MVKIIDLGIYFAAEYHRLLDSVFPRLILEFIFLDFGPFPSGAQR